MASIRMVHGAYGHVSVLSTARDLVMHAHAEAHVIVWLEGEAGQLQVGRRLISPGRDVAVGINPLQPHSHQFADNVRPGAFLAFYIDAGWLACRYGRGAEMTLFQDPRIALGNPLRRDLLDLITNIGADGNSDPAFEPAIVQLIDRLVVKGGGVLPLSRSEWIRAGLSDYRVRKAIALMKANVCERMKFDAVARNVGLSRPHFFALFKAQTNLTPNVYWNMLRMEEAFRQLQVTNDPLISVAGNLGFTSHGNFTRFFRDHAGVPPAQYREATRLDG